MEAFEKCGRANQAEMSKMKDLLKGRVVFLNPLGSILKVFLLTGQTRFHDGFSPVIGFGQ